jgi:peptidyl-tRNA hydrolase, PTH1 family
MKLIIGLGNPGNEYATSRHNAGFMVVETLADGATWASMPKLRADIAKIKTSFFLGQTILLAKPTTFMNLSGEALRAISSYYKIAPEDILVIHDEMDLSPGSLAFLAKGGPAGHNGIISIHEQMGRTDIARLRLGVGRPAPPIAHRDPPRSPSGKRLGDEWPGKDHDHVESKELDLDIFLKIRQR